MRILFVCPYTPTAIRTRPYNLLRSLAANGHDLTLATVWEREAERPALDSLAKLGIRVHSAPLRRGRIGQNLLESIARGQPLQARFCWEPGLARQMLAGAAERPFDVIHVEHLRGAVYGLALRGPQASPAGRPTPVLWDSVDCISLLFSQAAKTSRSLFGRWVSRLELPRTRRYEGYLATQFNAVVATSAGDLAALQRLATEFGGGKPMPPTQVLPNGVDVDYFQPNFGPRWPSTIVLTGKMSYHANVTAAIHLLHDIMPLVWAEVPECRVVIAGSAPPRPVQALAETHSGRVRVTGFVSDLRPYLQQATVAVAPIAYGAGIQNKVLEALASATPMIASPQAVSALSVRPDIELLVAGTPAAFAQAIVLLLREPAVGQRLGAAGYRYVTQNHHWPAIASQLETTYDLLCSS
jgi:glycosyltransferase involved in cell wall biosynthesis